MPLNLFSKKKNRDPWNFLKKKKKEDIEVETEEIDYSSIGEIAKTMEKNQTVESVQIEVKEKPSKIKSVLDKKISFNVPRFKLPSLRRKQAVVKTKKYRIGWFLKIKRGLAGILSLMFIITGFMGIENPMAFLFFLTAFLLADYIWKTRRKKLFQQ